MPPAARISDTHTCPQVDPGPTPHAGGPVVVGEPSVLIGHQPAARTGDVVICTGPPDSIAQGERTVLIGGKPAARFGDPTSHGGVLTGGDYSVLIGSSAQAEALRTDRAFCEECEAKQQEREARAARGRE